MALRMIQVTQLSVHRELCPIVIRYAWACFESRFGLHPLVVTTVIQKSPSAQLKDSLSRTSEPQTLTS